MRLEIRATSNGFSQFARESVRSMRSKLPIVVEDSRSDLAIQRFTPCDPHRNSAILTANCFSSERSVTELQFNPIPVRLLHEWQRIAQIRSRFLTPSLSSFIHRVFYSHLYTLLYTHLYTHLSTITNPVIHPITHPATRSSGLMN